MATLLGPDGAPLRVHTSEIPFIRAYPSGERVLQTIDRGPAIYAMAIKFIARGGRYLCAMMADNHIELVAGMEASDGSLIKVAHETSGNGPELADAVDKLVKSSVEHMDTVQ